MKLIGFLAFRLVASVSITGLRLVSVFHASKQDTVFYANAPFQASTVTSVIASYKPTSNAPQLVPNHTDPQTVLSMARMTRNSYYEPSDKDWDLLPGWNVSASFGWQNSGIRGYLFADDSQGVLVIALKGTSLATPIVSGPTARLDKLNDNMMFSCCCAKAGWEWTPICDCPVSATECSQSCIIRESNFDGSYYNLAQTIYLAVQEWFPKHTNIWMAGHSLGGALAALTALTNGVPAFCFESPGDLLFASRIGLLPRLSDPTEFLQSLPIYHFGNSQDPIFLGLCTGITSSCYWLDYALETKCHIGHECIYTSTTARKPSRLVEASDDNPFSIARSIQYHSIDFVIKNYLLNADSVPECTVKPQCLQSECPNWNFVE